MKTSKSSLKLALSAPLHQTVETLITLLGILSNGKSMISAQHNITMEPALKRQSREPWTGSTSDRGE